MPIRMYLYGIEDKKFPGKLEFTGKPVKGKILDKDVRELRDGVVARFLDTGKVIKCFSVCEDSFEKLFRIFKRHALKKADMIHILMRVPKKVNLDMCYQYHKKISKHMNKNCLDWWIACQHHIYRFDFFFYKQSKRKLRKLKLSFLEEAKNAKLRKMQNMQRI